MPATLDDLAEDLQRYFADRFPLDGDDGPGSVLLVFDNLGRPLSPKEFTGSDTAPARDLLSHQRAADLADQLPAANALKRGWYLPHGGSRLSRWYANLVRGSVGPPASAGEADLAAFEAAKAEALRAFELNQLATVSGTAVAGSSGTVSAAGTFDTYYATSMSPLDWYTDSATCWDTYSVDAADQPRSGTPAGPVTPPEFTLLVAEDTRLPEIVEYVQYATQTEPPRPDQPDPNPSLLTIPELELPPANPINEIAVSPTVVDRSGLSSAERLVEASSLVNLPEPQDDTGSEAVLIDRSARLSIDPALLAAFDSQAAAPAVADAVVPKSATSGQFSVHFEYCLVRLDRPWWDDTFLSRRDWRVPGYAPGTISTGSASHPDGDVTLVTIGMLVVRNLTITARWSAADLAALPKSTSLGPFCIAAGTFDQATGALTRKGMQAIAWLCRVPPVLPPSP